MLVYETVRAFRKEEKNIFQSLIALALMGINNTIDYKVIVGCHGFSGLHEFDM